MKKDGLTSKVLRFPKKLPRYARRRYVPYCDLGSHQGFILDERPCQKRRCENYHRLFVKNYKSLDNYLKDEISPRGNTNEI